MNDKTTYFLLTFLLMISLQSCGQTSTNVTIPAAFVETTPPNPGSAEWSLLNYSSNEFSVSIKNGQLEIKKTDEIHKCELKLETGTLIGINRGEWGGNLTFQPKNNSKNPIEIKKGNIKFIFTFMDKIYFIEGLAHLSISEGALYELESTGDNFKYKKILDFDDSPEAFTIYNDKILIATHRNFYVVKDFKKEQIFKDTFWSSLYPNSIAVFDDKNVLLGIRSGIVRLDLTTRTMKFYKNNK